MIDAFIHSLMIDASFFWVCRFDCWSVHQSDRLSFCHSFCPSVSLFLPVSIFQSVRLNSISLSTARISKLAPRWTNSWWSTSNLGISFTRSVVCELFVWGRGGGGGGGETWGNVSQSGRDEIGSSHPHHHWEVASFHFQISFLMRFCIFKLQASLYFCPSVGWSVGCARKCIVGLDSASFS